MDLTEFQEPVVQTLARQKADEKLGIPDDAPEELRIAMRNMGPLTRKRFLSKLNNEKLSEAQYNEYVKQFGDSKWEKKQI